MGLLAVIYLGIFALDAFTGDKAIIEEIGDFCIHAAPSFLVFAVVMISWKRQWIAGTFFTAIALYYALTTLDRVDWILAISFPLLVTGLLYYLSWWKREYIKRTTLK